MPGSRYGSCILPCTRRSRAEELIDHSDLGWLRHISNHGLCMKDSESVDARGIRPRILFLCQTLPYPPDGGVNIRAFHLLRILASRYEVTALCFYREGTRKSPDAIREGISGLSRFAHRVEAFPIPQERSRVRWVWDHLRSVVSGRVYTAFTHDSAPFQRRLNELLESEEFDLAHVDSLDLSWYLPALRDLPVVVDHHNVESQLLHRRAQTESNPLRRHYIGHQSRLMQKEEVTWCPKVALNLAVSEEDGAQLRSQSPSANVIVVPNGVDTDTFVPGSGPEEGIVFVGGHTWFPNRDGMGYFADSILPLIRKELPEITVTWVGRAPPELVEHYREQHGIQLTGYVDDIRPYVQGAACFIVPLRVGGGTRLKILDAWAMGKAVVSTSQGAEGLDARDGWNILIRDDPAEFATAVIESVQDPALRSRLGSAGRDTVLASYSWDIIGDALHSELQSRPRSS